VLFALRYGAPLTPLLGRLGPLRFYGVAVLTSFATFLMASGVVWALEVLGMESYRYSDGYVQEGWGWWAPVLSIAILPAVFEEIAFRGLIPQSLGRYLTVNEATLVSAGLFAVLHLSVPSVPHLFVMGMVLAALCRWSGSLYPAMLLHFCHNGLVVVAEQWEALVPW
jgi:membrane protease YdiL (CAAX protease family)